MNEQERWRLQNLSQRDGLVDPDFFAELYASHWPLDNNLRRDFRQWLETSRSVAAPSGDDRAPRYAFEKFLGVQGLLPIHFAASKLGMNADSLRELLERVPQIGLRKTYEVYENQIDESLAEDLTRRLPGLRFKTFGTHDAFCQLLHAAIHEHLGMRISPLYCRTSEEMCEWQNGHRMFASTWDNVAMQPISVKHQVWLDLGKPLSLSPDRCSKLFYARNREELAGLLAGREEPRDLDEYLQFLHSQSHA